jgi:predicted ATPase
VAAAPPTNLVSLPTSFVGRADALRALRAVLARAKLVTILGPPGTGKTRIAREIAWELLSRPGELPGGAWFCDLSEAATLDDVTLRLAATLSVELPESIPLAAAMTRIGAALQSRPPLLLVFDNFEQLVRPAAGGVAALLGHAREGTRFLVTSRERLGIAGEALFDLGPLSLPGEGSEASSEAVQLFVERARSACHTFRADGPETLDVARLVRLLDGLPLAIELAAARVRMLSPAELIQRLESRFQLLTNDPSTLRSRPTTLWETIDASWTLLTPWEQSTLAQISSFRGGFSVEAAERVIDLAAFAGAPDALSVLQSLRDRSLMHELEPTPSGRRFAILASIREFGEAKLAPADQRRAHERHARVTLELGERLAAQVDARDDAGARERLKLERENVVAVHQRFLDGAPPQLGGASIRAALVLACPVFGYPYATCLELLESAMSAPGAAGISPALLARALEQRGNILRFVGRAGESIADFERVRAVASDERDDALLARAISGLANAATVGARWREAGELFERALVIHERAGDKRSEGRVLAMLAATKFNQDQPVEARSLLSRAVDLQRETSDRVFEGISVTSLGIVALAMGSIAQARAHLTDALRIHREVGARHWEGVTLSSLAELEHEAGRRDEAHALYDRSLALLREVDVRRAEGLAQAALARSLLEEGRLDEAKEHYRAALDVCRRTSPDHEGLLLGGLATIAALEGDAVSASDLFSCADKAVSPHTRPAFAAAIEVRRGHLDLARAASASPDARPELEAAARARLDRAVSSSVPSSEVRSAIRLLERALAPPAADPDTKDALVIGPRGVWFRPPRAAASVRLHRRRSLQRLVHELAEHRLRAPGEAVTIADLVSFGWPGERVLPDAGAERVYTAVATLRKLGLKNVLLRRDDGYLLDPELSLLRSSSPAHADI